MVLAPIMSQARFGRRLAARPHKEAPRGTLTRKRDMMDKRSAVVDELSKIRGAIRLPESMTRRGFVAGAGMAAAAVAAGVLLAWNI